MVQTEDSLHTQQLFGGAVTCDLPARFEDISEIRPVPDHQEVHADAAVDQSIIIEILARKPP